jgi:23S rRNA (adenine2503-C2)-methyltransferase
MGMGEPLHNFDAVMESIALLTDADGFALGPRRLTVSTVGLPHRIVAMAEHAVPVRLAVSLVAADQDVRAGLMPVARRHPLNDLVDAIRRYGEGRRDHPTLEVVLLDGVNDDRRLARKLVEFARRARAKVNLIEFNPTPELPFRPSPEATIQMFLRVLGDGGVVGTVRRSRGGDAYAACGQLAFLERRT